MTKQFKVGDRVRCVDDGGGKSGIKNGQEYSVSLVAPGFIGVDGIPLAQFYPWRFEMVVTAPKCFRILRKGIQWGTTEYSSVEDAEAAIKKSAPVGEPFVIVELSTVKAVTVKRVLEAA